jgi:hypothetical protein
VEKFGLNEFIANVIKIKNNSKKKNDNNFLIYFIFLLFRNCEIPE